MAGILKETKGYKNLVFIGDGATDLEASPPAVRLVRHADPFMSVWSRTKDFFVLVWSRTWDVFVLDLIYCNLA